MNDSQRPHWSPPKDEDLRKEIQEVDIGTIDDRLNRLRFIYEEFGPPAHMLLVGGFPAMLAINELQRSFIVGSFLATILTAQVFVEHSMGGGYRMAGEDSIAHSGFKRLIDESRTRGNISGEVADRLHELREMRNPYTHPTSFHSPRSFMMRMETHGYDPHRMAEADAMEAIRIVVDYIRNQSPEWVPKDE